MKVSLCLCEGPHDTALLSRLMHSHGYKSYNNKLKDYPNAIKGFLKRQMDTSTMDTLNFPEIKTGRILPSYALINIEGNHICLLFPLGGDNRKDKRKIIVESYDNLYRNSLTMDKNEDVELSIVYFLDADKKGVKQRESDVNSELSQFIKYSNNAICHGKYDTFHNIRYGIFVFSDTSGFGRLEDLILPAMQSDNSDIYSCAESYLMKRNSFVLFNSGNYDKDYDKQKSLISVMGQLQKSGSANPAIIEQSAFISDTYLKNNQILSGMADFLKN